MKWKERVMAYEMERGCESEKWIARLKVWTGASEVTYAIASFFEGIPRSGIVWIDGK